jgi:hypothetical protein
MAGIEPYIENTAVRTAVAAEHTSDMLGHIAAEASAVHLLKQQVLSVLSWDKTAENTDSEILEKQIVGTSEHTVAAQLAETSSQLEGKRFQCFAEAVGKPVFLGTVAHTVDVHPEENFAEMGK